MKRHILILLVVFLAMPAAAMIADKTPHFMISLDKDVYQENEEIHMTVTFINPNEKRIRLALYDQPMAGITDYKYFKLYVQRANRKPSGFYLHKRGVSTEIPVVGVYIEPHRHVELTLPVRKTLNELSYTGYMKRGHYQMQLHYGVTERYAHVGYWTGFLKSNLVRFRVRPEKFISRDEALRIGRDAWFQGRASYYGVPMTLDFNFPGREYIVTINPAHLKAQTYPRADYDGQVTVNALTGEVKEILVGP